MQLKYSEYFRKAVKKLPESQQKKLAELLVIFSENPFYPLLHTKRLMGKLSDTYSFRITRDYRALFVFESKDVIKLESVGHRKDIYS